MSARCGGRSPATLATTTALAQLTPEQVLNICQITDLSFSRDGRRVAFTVTDPVKGSDRNRDPWMLDVATRQTRQLTFSPKSENQPRRHPIKNELAFLSNRDEATRTRRIRSARASSSTAASSAMGLPAIL